MWWHLPVNTSNFSGTDWWEVSQAVGSHVKSLRTCFTACSANRTSTCKRFYPNFRCLSRLVLLKTQKQYKHKPQPKQTGSESYIAILEPVHARKLSCRDDEDNVILLPVARCTLMTHKYRGSQQSSREVLPKFIDSTQGEPKNICKP
jgi:hypothetical protein